MSERVQGYDLVRSLAILIVFFGHIFETQASNATLLLAVRSLSPGLTLSLLGFISAALLSSKEYDYGIFLVKRFTRIYISLVLCLVLILFIHACIGRYQYTFQNIMGLRRHVISQHTLLHLMGLSAFFEMFSVQNNATIGKELWFITAIVSMYLFLPLLQKLLRHPRGLFHLILIVLLCTAMNFVMYGTQSVWNIAISFSVGAFLGANEKISRLINGSLSFSVALSAVLLGLASLSTAGMLPYAVRGMLFAFYPLGFVPLLFAAARKLPRSILTASGFFAGLSYEFYILQTYFGSEGLRDFLPGTTALSAQIFISFSTTLVLAYVLSRLASRCRKAADRYLLVS